MSLVSTRSGCKVGWEIYDDEAEALAAASRETEARERMLKDGYDFGYQWPGAVKHFLSHPDYDDREVWVVVTT